MRKSLFASVRSEVLLLLIVATATVPGARSARAAEVEDQDPISPLLEKHLQWLGGREKFSEVQSLVFEGTMSASGLRGPVTIRMTRDGRRRLDYDLGVVSGTEVSGPDEGWEINPSGQVEEMGRDKLRRSFQESELELGRHLLDPTSFSRQSLGTEERDHLTWQVVRFTAGNGDAYDFLLDPEGGSLTWVRSIEDTDTTQTRYSDWRWVAGMRVAFRVESFHRNPMENSKIEWTAVRVNEEIDPSIFTRPEKGRQIAYLREGAPEWVPIRLVSGRHVYIDATVNGVDTEVVLDTGAGITVLDAKLASEIGKVGGGALSAVGTGGAVQASVVHGIDIVIGGLELRNLTAAVVDLSQIADRFGVSMPVILGKELFHNVVVDLDYPGSRIAFRDPSTFEYRGTGRALELIPGQDGHKLVRATVEKLDPALFTVDTGAGGTLTLFKHYHEENGILASREKVSDSMSGGVGGLRTSKLSTLRSFTLAGYEMKNVPVDLHVDTEIGAFDTKDIAGNLGAGILSRFRVIFDYERDRMYLEPPPGPLDQPFQRNRAGLEAYPSDEGFEVIHVRAGSPAEAQGWKAGNRITAVNGEALTRDIDAWRDYLDRPAGTELVLRDGSGEEKTLVLADYY
jgi:predicted aspartyl protease